MKIVKEEFIIKKGDFSKSQELSMMLQYTRRAINLVTWPENSSSFSINPTPKGNGVKPIKEKCMKYLQQQGWILEKRISITSDNNAGPIDALFGLGINSSQLNGKQVTSHQVIGLSIKWQLECFQMC